MQAAWHRLESMLQRSHPAAPPCHRWATPWSFSGNTLGRLWCTPCSTSSLSCYTQVRGTSCSGTKVTSLGLAERRSCLCVCVCVCVCVYVNVQVLLVYIHTNLYLIGWQQRSHLFRLINIGLQGCSSRRPPPCSKACIGLLELPLHQTYPGNFFCPQVSFRNPFPASFLLAGLRATTTGSLKPLKRLAPFSSQVRA
jgi:hypothetical protein